MTSTPVFASTLRTDADSQAAVDAAIADVRAGLHGARANLVVAFVSHHHGAAIEDLGPRLASELFDAVVLGCTGEGIVGGEREIERGPAIALWAAHLPNTEVRPFEVQGAQDEEGRHGFTALPEVTDPKRASVLLLADPFTFPTGDFLRLLNDKLPGVPAIGGMASGGSGPGQNLLFTGSGVVDGGAIGVVVEGDVEVRAVVSQGCRPVGKPFVITSCKENVIHKLGGKSAIQALVETFTSLSEGDQKLIQRHPFVGLALDPTKSRFERGDFLARGIIGADNQAGSIAVGDGAIRVGQTMQFLVRDPSSAGDDLSQLVRASRGATPAAADSLGALLFSCNGRGTRMFATPDHDARTLRGALEAPVPVAGFFALGEIGPVGGRNFLHGFTASVALFREREG